MKRIKIKHIRIGNSKMLQEDQGTFYRKWQETKQLKEKVPKMEKFGEFWTGLREGNTKTPRRKRMNTVAKKIGQKVTNVQEFTITENYLHQTVKKLKNCSTPGIDGGTWSAILRCFNQWLEQPDEIPDLLTQGQTVLLPKIEDLRNERNY